MIDLYNFSLVGEASDPVRKGPPYETRVFLTNLIFFRQNEIILQGKKRTALFQTYNWEKSSFFNALVRTCICKDMCKYMAPPGPNRVKLTKIFCHACFQCKIEFKSGFVFFNFWISGLLTYR